jgi:hypothetical protein
MQYASGTSLDTSLKRIAKSADTFFSIPASVTFKGKTVAGFVRIDTLNNPEATVQFTPYAYRKHGDIFDAPDLPSIS